MNYNQLLRSCQQYGFPAQPPHSLPSVELPEYSELCSSIHFDIMGLMW
jgi:hypothetical protein